MKTWTDLYWGDFHVFSEKTKKAGIDNFMSCLEALCALWVQSYVKLFEQVHNFMCSALCLRPLWLIQSWVGRAWNFLLMFVFRTQLSLFLKGGEAVFYLLVSLGVSALCSWTPKSPSVPFWDISLSRSSCLNPSLLFTDQHQRLNSYQPYFHSQDQKITLL